MRERKVVKLKKGVSLVAQLGGGPENGESE
jgi:hypothetical protein